MIASLYGHFKVLLKRSLNEHVNILIKIIFGENIF
jgi:hypothetical protein